MRLVGLSILLLAGCATTTGIGAHTMVTPDGDGSVEITAGGGVGLGDDETSWLLRGDGAIGIARDGGTQGRVQLGGEWVSFGEEVGWHLRSGTGGSFGAYQSPDLTVQLTAGPQWTLQRSEGRSELRITSVALDATVGYGFRGADGKLSLDGAFVGVGVSVRRDKVDNLGIKYWPRTKFSSARSR